MATTFAQQPVGGMTTATVRRAARAARRAALFWYAQFAYALNPVMTHGTLTARFVRADTAVVTYVVSGTIVVTVSHVVTGS